MFDSDLHRVACGTAAGGPGRTVVDLALRGCQVGRRPPSRAAIFIIIITTTIILARQFNERGVTFEVKLKLDGGGGESWEGIERKRDDAPKLDDDPHDWKVIVFFSGRIRSLSLANQMIASHRLEPPMRND